MKQENAQLSLATATLGYILSSGIPLRPDGEQQAGPWKFSILSLLTPGFLEARLPGHAQLWHCVRRWNLVKNFQLEGKVLLGRSQCWRPPCLTQTLQLLLGALEQMKVNSRSNEPNRRKTSAGNWLSPPSLPPLTSPTTPTSFPRGTAGLQGIVILGIFTALHPFQEKRP